MYGLHINLNAWQTFMDMEKEMIKKKQEKIDIRNKRIFISNL